jgi:hypothetical protein
MNDKQMPNQQISEEQKDKDYEFFLRELPRLLAENHEGQFVLIRYEELLKFFVNMDDALLHGYRTYGPGNFIIQEIRDDSNDVHYIDPKCIIKAG